MVYPGSSSAKLYLYDDIIGSSRSSKSRSSIDSSQSSFLYTFKQRGSIDSES